MMEIGKMIGKQEKVFNLKSLGVYVLPNRGTYEGEVFDGIITGVGMIIKRSLGTFNFLNGETYTGEWKDGVMDGNGTSS